MKISKILVAIILLGIVITSADAQVTLKKKKYNESITFNPVSLVFGAFDVTYEKALSKDNSFTASLSYYSYDAWVGYNLGGSYRWYKPLDKRHIIEGFSFGPAINFTYWDYSPAIESASDAYDGGISVQIGGEIAYKMVIEKWFVVEPIAKFYLPLFSPDGLTDNFQYFGLGVNLGYGW